MTVYKDNACGEWNCFTPNYEVLLVFCSFLCVSLNVLLSLLNCYRNFYKKEEISPTHSNLHTEMSKIQSELHI